jgi:hypothetical protein
MTHERRDEITGFIFEVFRARPILSNSLGKMHPVPYSRMAIKIQERARDVTIEEVDHVLVQLCTRLVMNLIDGQLFFTGGRGLRSDDVLDADKIDWLYGSGRQAG